MLDIKKRLRRVQEHKIIYLISISLLFILLLFYSFFLFLPNSLSKGETFIEVTIDPGMTPVEMAYVLHDRDVIRHVKSFLWAAKLMGVSRKLQAGRYRFRNTKNNYHILKKLRDGKVYSQKVTFPEGIRITRLAAILKSHFDIDSTFFVDLALRSAIHKEYNLPAQSLEGYLYPNTYYFHPHVAAVDVIDRMVSHFFETLPDSLYQRMNAMHMSLHKVVTLASIVEGEAVLESERPDIAALYHNRLKKRMMLQADPTIQYIIHDGPRRLLKRDLEIESPYNTYLHRGLPPGPVNNPSVASLMAVLYPADVSYLYMVANGDGSHTFSCTLQDHLKAKRRFDRLRKKINHRD